MKVKALVVFLQQEFRLINTVVYLQKPLEFAYELGQLI